MTKEALSSLYFLNREIELMKDKLEELEQASDSCSSSLTGMPRGTEISDRVSRYACQIHDLKLQIEQGIMRCFAERARLERFIQEVPDSEMRMILSLRYVNGMSFQQIAFSIGYQDESVPRKRHERFLKRSEEKKKDAQDLKKAAG